MLDDRQLLRGYADDGSELAFGELVARYVNLVYSAALRRAGGDTHLAQDVAQLVFTDLARKSRSLPDGVVLAGWLHRATQYAATQLLRTESRRVAREQEAVAMNTLESEPTSDWDQIRPLLDEALDRLDRTDRDALLLRFFEQRSLAEVGNALGSTEEAARKRVARALEKLRAYLVRRGVATTGAALSTVLSAHAIQIAPAGLVATLTSASLASAVAGTETTLTLLKLIAMTKLKVGIVSAIVVAGVATPLLIQHQAQIKLREENQSLRQQIAQLSADSEGLFNRLARAKSTRALRLPAPPVQLAVPLAEPTDASQSTNLLARFPGLEAKAPNRLSAAQLEAYLTANGRNAASLLAAYRTTGDPALLQEAMQRYPNDPQVALGAALRKDASPEERRQWLETLKQSDPANALPNYLSALDCLKAGQTDQAVQELVAASGKQQFEDYSAHRVQDNEQAYLAAGYSVAEAKAIGPLQQAMYLCRDEVEATFAPFQSQLTQLQQVKEVYLNVVDLAESYKQAGDQASAQAALQIAVNLCQRYSNKSGEDGLSRLVGISGEVMARSAMDPNSSYDGSGQTVQDRINQLKQQRTAIGGLYRQAVPLLGTMSDQDWISYADRARAFGEPAALQWVLGKYGQK